MIFDGQICKSNKPGSKNGTLENRISDVLIASTLCFCHYRTTDTRTDAIFAGKSNPKRFDFISKRQFNDFQNPFTFPSRI